MGGEIFDLEDPGYIIDTRFVRHMLADGAAAVPWLFTALKWGSAAYILYLAWRIALSRIRPGEAGAIPPGFASGLIVHPLNPKAWVMITAGFTGFVAEGTPAFTATLGIALVLLSAQIVLQPLWCWGGERIAVLVGGRPAERWVMLALAGATVLSVFYALASGGTP